MTRVQVQPTNGPQQITPQAAPIFSPITTPRARPGTAQSLAGFGGAIADFAATYEEQQIEDARVEAYDQLQGMTLEEADAAVKSSQMSETDNPYFQAAFEKQFGIAYAAQRKREIVQSYETEFDKDNGDLEEFLIGVFQEDQNAYGGNEFVSSGIREGMGGFLDTVRMGR